MKPIIFSTETVRATLEDRKTMTRRPVKPQPLNIPSQQVWPNKDGGWSYWIDGSLWQDIKCPYGQVGDVLYVKEDLVIMPHDDNGFLWTHYKADNKQVLIGGPGRNKGVIWEWKKPYLSSRFCPRWASRISLEITGVRVERLLSDTILNDVHAEGFLGFSHFFEYWDSLYRKKPEYRSSINPWVWCIEFKRIEL